jgi:hypothetical protein
MKAEMQRIRDFVTYSVVGIAIVVGAYLYQASFGSDVVPVAKWGGLAGMTAILFGGVITSSHRIYRQSGLFWYSIAGLLAAHVLVFVAILRQVDQWKAIWFVFFFPLEIPVIEGALRFVMRRWGVRGSGRRKA